MLVSMSRGISIETGMKGGGGGLFGGLKRSLGEESFFINKFTVEIPGGITMAPPLLGDIHAMDLDNQRVFVSISRITNKCSSICFIWESVTLHNFLSNLSLEIHRIW